MRTKLNWDISSFSKSFYAIKHYVSIDDGVISLTVTFKSLIPELAAITLIGLLVLGPAHADVIAVCTSGCNYTSIVEAIDAADPGDIIEVQSGTYRENIVIKKRITLQGVDTGEGRPVVDADNRGAAINLSADGINLKGFKIINSKPPRGAIGMFFAGIKALSNNNVIEDNTAINNQCGIYLKDSSNNTVMSNNFTDNIEYGIRLLNSSNNTMRYNQILGNGYNFGLEGLNSSHFRNDIDTSNLVDGKPIYYLVGAVDEIIDSYSNAGAVYCIDCNNVTVSDLNLKKNSHGIYFYETKGSRIMNNSLTDNLYGVYIQNSSNNAVVMNNASFNLACGICLTNSSNNLIVENNISSNDENGTILLNSSNNTMRNNIMLGNRYNFGSVGQNISRLKNDIDGTNLVDGKAIYYLVGSRDEIIDSHSNAGTVWCIDCNNVTVKDLVLVNNIHGVCLSNTTNSRIENSTINDNLFGIFLEHSNSNLIKNNSVNHNKAYGILLVSSGGNNITGNNANSNGEEDFQGPKDNHFENNTFGHLRTDLPPEPSHDNTHATKPPPTDDDHKERATTKKGGSSRHPYPETTISKEPAQIKPRDLDKLAEEASGCLMFNPPAEMWVGIGYWIDARIAKENTTLLIENLLGKGEQKYREINVTVDMSYSVTLCGEKEYFDIRRDRPDIQILGEDPAVWLWYVTPLKEGNGTLILSVDVVVDRHQYLNMTRWPVQIRIEEMSYIDKTKYFIDTYWQWIIGILISSGVIKWLIGQLKSRKRAKPIKKMMVTE